MSDNKDVIRRGVPESKCRAIEEQRSEDRNKSGDRSGLHLCVRNYSGSFRSNGNAVIKDIDLDLHPGELVGVVGASGSGKSCLLKHVFHVFSRKCSKTGSITWEQRDWNRKLKTRRDLAPYIKFVPLNDVGSGNLTVYEALQFQLTFRRCPHGRSTIMRIIELLGLETCAHNIVGGTETCRSELSHGQRRRLAIGLEALGGPAALLLDEPTSGLDSASSLHIMRLLRYYCDSRRGAVLLTIHQPTDMMFAMFDRMYVMSQGRVVCSGTPARCVNFFKHCRLPPALSHLPLRGCERLFVIASKMHTEFFQLQPLDPLEPLETEEISTAEASAAETSADEDDRVVVEKRGGARPSGSMETDLNLTAFPAEKNAAPESTVLQRLVMTSKRSMRSNKSLTESAQRSSVILSSSASASSSAALTNFTDEMNLIPSHEVLPKDLPIFEGSSKTQRCNILKEFLLCLKQQFLLRLREPGVLQTITLVFGVLLVLLCSIYWKIPARLETLSALSDVFIAPPGDSPSLSAGDSLSASLASNRRLAELPESFKLQAQYFWSALNWGLDGESLMPWVDLIHKGPDHRGGEVLPWALATQLSSLPSVADCMHTKLDLATKYPDIQSAWPDVSPTTSVHSTKPPPVLQTSVITFLKAYQLLDHLILKIDWSPTKACLRNELINGAGTYLCILSYVPEVLNALTDCSDLPRVPELLLTPPSSTKNVLTDPESESDALTSFSLLDAGLSDSLFSLLEPFLSRQSMPSFAEADESTPSTNESRLFERKSREKSHLYESAFQGRGRRQLKDASYDEVLKSMPFNLELNELLARIFTPTANREIANRSWQAALDIINNFVEKARTECGLMICVFFAQLPTVIAGFAVDILSHTWIGLDICALNFVLIAVVGCWGMECALTFPRSRARFNRDSLNGTNHIVIVGFARMLVDMLFQTIPVLLLTITAFYSADLGDRHQFGTCLSVLLLLCYATSGVVSLIAVVAHDVNPTVLVSSAWLTATLILCGFVLRGAADEKWHKIVGTISAFRYAYSALIQNFFVDGNYFGAFSNWFASGFLGGIVPGEGPSIFRCQMMLFMHAAVSRAAALLFLPFLHRTRGLKQA